jgi:transposase InsO family protein
LWFRANVLLIYADLRTPEREALSGQKLEDWRKYYNEERPHGAIGQKTPITLLNHVGATSPPS